MVLIRLIKTADLDKTGKKFSGFVVNV